ncbi:MAG: BlaI/MecI/CopY family transcriptional regulator [Bacteroidaceae bacterium]|nr:BlaI/MecI/CopY family transcriptional regulator [Bacteroidaceae bacterium]
MKDKKQLTKAETQVMNILWSLPESKGYSSEIISKFPEPKPALTTLLTFLKILKDKGFVTSEKRGKSQLFCAAVEKEEYTRSFMKEVKNTFFGGSLKSMFSFFAQNEDVSEEDLKEIMELIKKK